MIKMPRDTCLVCGNNRSNDPGTCFHCFPSDPERRSVWLSVFQLSESDVKSYSRACSRHFPDGEVKNNPQVNLGKRFASPLKKEHPRAKRAKRRREDKELCELREKSESRSRSVTPASTTPAGTPQASRSVTPQTSLPDNPSPLEKGTAILVNTALVARIEALEAENRSLKKKNVAQPEGLFRIKQKKMMTSSYVSTLDSRHM